MIPVGRNRALLGASRRWSPLRLFAAGEQGAWYDPSDITSMFQDSAGTVPVTATGDPVGKILDLSGRGNHRTQPTAIARPTLQQDGNGKYYLDYNGTNSAMLTAAIDLSAADKVAFWVGMRRDSSAAAGVFVEFSSDFNSNNAFILLAPTGANTTVQFGTHDVASTNYSAADAADAAAPSLSVFSGTADRALATNEDVIRRNGVDVTTRSVNNNLTGNFGNYPLYFGARAGTSLFFKGREYGSILRATTVATSAAQLSAGDAYMNGKTGAY